MLTRGSLEPYIKDDVNYYDHQVTGIRKLCGMRNFLLADEMGLGKSLEAITVFAHDVYVGYSHAAIVVCPTSLKGNWYDEVEKFTRMVPYVLEGSPEQRSKQIAEFTNIKQPKFLITNYEQVIKHVMDFNALAFDAGIYDEAHYIKGPTALRTKAAHDLITRRNFLLTGTPMLGHANDLWSLLHKIDPHAFPRYHKFVSRYCVFGGYKDKQIVGTKNEKELRRVLQNFMLRRLKKDVLDLPEVQIIQRRVDLLPEAKRIYDSMRDDLRTVRPDGIADEDIDNALVLFTRLKQVCGTTKSFNGKDISGKLDLVIEDDIEILNSGRKTIVWTQFREVQQCYIERMQKARPGTPVYYLNGDIKPADRKPLVDRWAADAHPAVLVCMLQVGGVGLTMTAARDAAFVDKLFVPGLNKQAIDRQHRIGADLTQPIQVRDYITRGTIELRVEQINQNKNKLFAEIVENSPDWKRLLMEQLRASDAA